MAFELGGGFERIGCGRCMHDDAHGDVLGTKAFGEPLTIHLISQLGVQTRPNRKLKNPCPLYLLRSMKGFIATFRRETVQQPTRSLIGEDENLLIPSSAGRHRQ